MEQIHIGSVHFSKMGAGPWVRREDVPLGLSHPASIPQFRRFNCRLTAENPTAITCVIRARARVESERDLATNTFWFDEKGILFKREAIVFNGVSWSRHTWLYEYDPSIRIEAPHM